MSTSASAVSGIGEAFKPVRMREPLRRLRSIGMADAPPPVPVFGRAMHPSIGGSAQPTVRESGNGMGHASLNKKIF
jgi:hypothetical protein